MRFRISIKVAWGERKVELDPTKEPSRFCRFVQFFWSYDVAPTQWTVGDYSPLKESPGRGPAAR